MILAPRHDDFEAGDPQNIQSRLRTFDGALPARKHRPNFQPGDVPMLKWLLCRELVVQDVLVFRYGTSLNLRSSCAHDRACSTNDPLELE